MCLRFSLISFPYGDSCSICKANRTIPWFYIFLSLCQGIIWNPTWKAIPSRSPDRRRQGLFYEDTLVSSLRTFKCNGFIESVCHWNGRRRVSIVVSFGSFVMLTIQITTYFHRLLVRSLLSLFVPSVFSAYRRHLPVWFSWSTGILNICGSREEADIRYL